MENIIKKGVSVLFIYLLLFLFVICMTNRIEKLNSSGYAGEKTGVQLLK